MDGSEDYDADDDGDSVKCQIKWDAIPFGDNRQARLVTSPQKNIFPPV